MYSIKRHVPLKQETFMNLRIHDFKLSGRKTYLRQSVSNDEENPLHLEAFGIFGNMSYT